MKKPSMTRTGVYLPKSVISDLDFLASVTHTSRSVVVSALVSDVASEAVKGLKESQRLSSLSSDGKAKIEGVASDVLRSIFASKTAAIGGLDVDLSFLHEPLVE